MLLQKQGIMGNESINVYPDLPKETTGKIGKSKFIHLLEPLKKILIPLLCIRRRITSLIGSLDVLVAR